MPSVKSSVFYPFSYEYNHLNFESHNRNNFDALVGNDLFGVRYFGQNTAFGFVSDDGLAKALIAYNMVAKGVQGTFSLSLGEESAMLGDVSFGNYLFSYGAFFRYAGKSNDYVHYKVKKFLFADISMLAGVSVSRPNALPIIGLEYENDFLSVGYSVLMSQGSLPKGSYHIDYTLNDFTFGLQTNINDHKGFVFSLGYDLSKYIKKYDAQVFESNDHDNLKEFTHEKVSEANSLEKSVLLSFPPEETVTSKEQILIKGMFLKNGKVFINDEEAELAAGRFYSKYTLKKNGKNDIKIDFFDTSGGQYSVHKKVLKIKEYVDVLDENKNKKDIRNIGALNVLSGSNEDRFYPDRYVTRAELADAFVKISDVDYDGDFSVRILDVPSNYKYYSSIKKAVSNRLMSGFPDNTFRPEMKVSRAEMIVMLVRLSGLDINRSYLKHSFVDVNKKHWVNRYLNAATSKGMISKSKYFYPKSFVTRGMLVDFLKKNPLVKEQIKNLYDFDKGYYSQLAKVEPVFVEDNSDDVFEEIVEEKNRAPEIEEKLEKEFEEFIQLEEDEPEVVDVAIEPIVELQEDSELKPEDVDTAEPIKQEKVVLIDDKNASSDTVNVYAGEKLAEMYPDIKLFSPSAHQMVIKNEVLFKGRVQGNNKYRIKINSEKQVVSNSGRFFKKVNIDSRDSTINFVVNNDSFVFKVRKYHLFDDVDKKHWSFKYVIKATDKNLFLRSDKFEGTNPVTKRDMAYALSHLYDLASKASIKLHDVNEYEEGYKEIINALGSGFLTDKDGYFNPGALLKRSEVIFYLARYFKEIKKYYYVHYADVFFGKTFAYDQIGFFVDKGFISKSPNFKPDDFMTREQFAALLVRISDNISEK